MNVTPNSRGKAFSCNMSACQECGKGIASTGKVIPRFCSKACNSKWRYKNPSFPPSKCGTCGKVFIPKAKDRTQFCSRECGFVGQDRTISHQLFKAYVDEVSANTPPDPPPFSPVSFARCEYLHCGVIFRKHSGSQRFCCSECNRKDRLNVPTSEIRNCLECGKPFAIGEDVGVNTKTIYCSDKCSRKIARREARARRNGVYAVTAGMSQRVTFKALWDRSARCHICGEWCSKKYSGLHLLSPTVDHIVPISKGGMHLLQNAAIAHRLCNTLKGDRPVTPLVSAR